MKSFFLNKTSLGLFLSAVLATNAIVSHGDAPKSLQQLNTDWQLVMNNQNTAFLSRYYDEHSLLGQYPYDASKNLVGLSAIEDMFSNGPFKLTDLKANIDTLALDAKSNTAIVLKRWSINFDKGDFGGLALEVLEQTHDGWKRRIDLGAGGLSSITQFAQQDTEADNNAFGGIAHKLGKYAMKAQRHNLSKDAGVLDFSRFSKVNNLLEVKQGNRGLLISLLTQKEQKYLTFNALEQSSRGWVVQVQLVEKL